MTRTTPSRRPVLRPLACGVFVALAAVAASPLLARELDNTHETIDQDHVAEDWRLINGATLAVNGAHTHFISINDTSAVTLDAATVTRQAGSMSNYAMMVLDEGRATADRTAFVDGGIWVAGDASAELTNSSITLDADAPGNGEGNGYSWGLSINNNNPGDAGRPRVLLDASTITVADWADRDHYSTGLGAYMVAGELAMRNGSIIDAANVGVVMHGYEAQDHAVTLSLDNSHIVSGRGSAIEIAADRDVGGTYDLLIANGSTLKAGDGNLLLVRAYRETPTGNHSDINFTVDNSRLEGNITFDNRHMQGSVDVLLQNNASLKGIFTNVTTAGIDGGSAWTLTGDSSVGTLDLGATGTVDLGGSAAAFNTLTVGEFNGAGGTLVFNTRLEDDSSATDKLHITGDANGQANVRVNGVGGQGAQTDQGIELIAIDGVSNADFILQGRAVGGIYEYNKLLKGNNGNWYLHSQLEDGTAPDPEPEPDLCAVDPSTPDCVTLPVLPGDPEQPDPEQPDPEEPGKPGPVLRPETGAYLANQAAMDALLRHGARDRMNGTTATDGVRTWAATRHGESRMDVTGQQTLRTTQSSLQVGADMGVFDGGNGRVGVMLSAGQADATARSTVTGYRAEGTVEGGAAGVYAHWSNNATWLDASVQAGRFSNRVEGEGLAAERYDASVMQASLEAGHRFDVGQIGRMALSLQPEVQLTYSAVRMDQHVESNGTVITRDGGNGVSARVGVRLEGEAATAAGQFRPYVALHGYHDARRNALSFDGVRIEGALPGTRVELSAGGQVQFGRGLSGFGGVSASRGEEGYRDVGAKVGLTYRW